MTELLDLEPQADATQLELLSITKLGTNLPALRPTHRLRLRDARRLKPDEMPVADQRALAAFCVLNSNSGLSFTTAPMHRLHPDSPYMSRNGCAHRDR